MNADLDPSGLPQQPLPIPHHDAVHPTVGGAFAMIDLNGQTYSLRIARAGNLIPTK